MPGCPIIWMIEGQGPIARALGAGGSCLDFFTLSSGDDPKYYLKGQLNVKQSTNQPFEQFT